MGEAKCFKVVELRASVTATGGSMPRSGMAAAAGRPGVAPRRRSPINSPRANGWSCLFGAVLPNQFRQRPVVADEVLWTAVEVGELRGRDINAQALIERGEDFTEMDRPGSWFLAPARTGADDLAAPHPTAGHQRTGHPWPMVVRVMAST